MGRLFGYHSRHEHALKSEALCGSAARNRRGTTLTEVLMALLVMGIGIVSVASLFPLAVLRSVQATKLTSATILRNNAESFIRFSFSPPPPSGVGSFVPRNAFVEDPDQNGNVIEHEGSKYVVDPLGWAVLFADNGNTAAAGPIGDPDLFGDFTGDGKLDGDQDSDGAGDVDKDGVSDIPRFNFGIDKLPAAQRVDAAEKMVSLPDTYTMLAEALAGEVNVAGSNVTLNSNLMGEYAGLGTGTTAGQIRVVILDANLKNARVYTSASITNGTTVALGATDSGSVGKVLIELKEPRRYTWLATVRRYGQKPKTTIVVYFRRGVSPLDEKTFAVSETANTFNKYNIDISGGDPPGLKAGGWMFDTASFRWFKIADVDRSGTPATFTTDAGEIDTVATARTFQAMFPNNVVEAYTIRSR